MKPVDEQLNRLMKSAAQVPCPPAAAVFAMEARVLGQWRASLRNSGGDEILLLCFRRVAICAGILAIASLAWNYHDLTSRSSAEIVADSAMRMGVEP
jgi:hypothetical protein